MHPCPSCHAPQPAESKFCSECGRALIQEDDAPESEGDTATLPAPVSPRTSQAASSSSSIHGRFLPGKLIADRYRIVSLLGKGGMGEVYRADDLKLGQTVALKFLPPRLGKNPRRLELFHSEVRLTRQISHPHVCRVYDIGEVDGQHFLSMEYVDGEDLNALLRRIGHVSSAKGIEIAQQLCAGLAAAHQLGVLHRDLKPANIMLDGRGKVRIMDFGLAQLASDDSRQGELAGTPAYMAPEQLVRGETSVQSDLFALGLVLLEMFSGKATFRGKSPAEVRREHDQLSGNPSSLPSDLDPSVEPVILRCLERDATLRPRSVSEVAAALPGGDPLAAAVAAGETPSPAMVAAAGGETGMPLPWAVGCFATFVVASLLTSLIRPPRLEEYVPLPAHPTELAVRARDIVRELGYDVGKLHTTWGFAENRAYVEQIEKTDTSLNRWEVLKQARPPGLFYWHRWSRETLETSNIHRAKIAVDDPPLTGENSLAVRLDTRGFLRRLDAVAPQVSDEEAGKTTFTDTDWAPLFKLADLRFESFQDLEEHDSFPRFCEQAVAWRGTYPEQPHPPITVQAGQVGGQVVYFEVIDSPPSPPQPQVGVFGAVMFSGIWGVSLVLAWRNYKADRCDRLGAFRLGAFVMLLWLLIHAAVGAQILSQDIKGLAYTITNGQALGHALIHGLQSWLGYLAVEPYIRRVWPQMLVTWTRLMRGRYRDPRVGRDLLIGFAFGSCVLLARSGYQQVLTWLGRPLPTPPTQPDLIMGRWTDAVMPIFRGVEVSLTGGVLFTMVLLIFRLLTGRTLPAVVLACAVFSGIVLSGPEGDISLAVSYFLAMSLFAIVLVRFGFFTCLMAAYVFLVGVNQGLSLDFELWHTASQWGTFIFLVALCGYAALIAIGKPPQLADSPRPSLRA